VTTAAPIEQDWRTRSTIQVEDAAAILGVSRSSGYEAARTGQIPTLRIGRRMVVPVAALRRMLGELLPSDENEPGGEPDSISKPADGNGRNGLYA
jgi:excisionase family DNA binding protein